MSSIQPSTDPDLSCAFTCFMNVRLRTRKDRILFALNRLTLSLNNKAWREPDSYHWASFGLEVSLNKVRVCALLCCDGFAVKSFANLCTSHKNTRKHKNNEAFRFTDKNLSWLSSPPPLCSLVGQLRWLCSEKKQQPACIYLMRARVLERSRHRLSQGWPSLFFSLPTISTVPTDNYDSASEKHGPVMQHKRIEAQIPLD